MNMVNRSRQQCLFPHGHFYSPIADLKDIERRQLVIWNKQKDMQAISLDASAQLALMHQSFKPYVSDIDFPVEKSADPTSYYYRNDQFPVVDAEVLFCMLRHFKPRRMIEVGSGFSSLITAHVNRTFFAGALNFSCIEPYPRQFLIDGVNGISDLVVQKVEDIPVSYFESLKDGDILFIDSSHVSKVGSDVNYLFFEIIPRLNKGVLVHIHDIFLPEEYPKKWVIDEGRHWNEQYLVRAFLQFNTAFEILWASHFMAQNHTQEVHGVFPRFPSHGGGGSLWLRRVA
jgi:hypothetical protein